MTDREPTCDEAQVELQATVTKRWSRGTAHFEGWFGNSKLDLVVELDPECAHNYPVGAKIAGTLFIRPTGAAQAPNGMRVVNASRAIAEREEMDHE